MSAIRSYPARTEHMSLLSDHIGREPSICVCYPIISGVNRAYVSAIRSYPARTEHMCLLPDHIRRDPIICVCYPIISGADQSYISLSDHIPSEPSIYLAIRSYPTRTEHMSLLPDHIPRGSSICRCHPIISGANRSYMAAIRSYPA